MPSRYLGASTSCSIYYTKSVGRRIIASRATNKRYYDLAVGKSAVVVIDLGLLSENAMVVYLAIDGQREGLLIVDDGLSTAVCVAGRARSVSWLIQSTHGVIPRPTIERRS